MNFNNSDRPRVLTSALENDEIDRRMVAWANTFPDIPEEVSMVDYEQLPADTVGMAFSTIQSAFITRRFIMGGYEAEYQFKLIYRIKPGDSNNKRLAADELLNRFGDWATTQKPDIGEERSVLRIEPTSRSSMFGRYENGDEDHQILMKMTYEGMK